MRKGNMKESKTITVQEHQVTITNYICDTCGKVLTDTAWGRMKKCHICKGDVCRDCAIITDHWSLENGSFMGDYPDYYCKRCWNDGGNIRKKILACREREGVLWKQWHNLTQEL